MLFYVCVFLGWAIGKGQTPVAAIRKVIVRLYFKQHFVYRRFCSSNHLVSFMYIWTCVQTSTANTMSASHGLVL